MLGKGRDGRVVGMTTGWRDGRTGKATGRRMGKTGG